MPAFRDYRRWAFESAAADLALRQAGRSLADVLGREPQPVNFVVSLRLGEPPSAEPVTRRLAAYPGLQFKLDYSPAWDEELLAALAATGAVESIDFKGAYKGTVVDVETVPELYRRCAEVFPEAWLEDPDLTDPAADEALRPHRDRITWDAPIHGVEDIEALPFQPRTINVKPSRIGSWKKLLHTYEWCAERGDHQLRRRAVRAGRRPRPDPVPRVALPRRRGERHRSVGLRLARLPGHRPARPTRSRPTWSRRAFAGARRLGSRWPSRDR